MTILAVIGAGLQLALLLFTKWFTSGAEKKEERKALYEAGKKAIADRDASAITSVLDRMRRI